MMENMENITPLRRSTRQQERKETICNTRSKPNDQNRNDEGIDDEGLEILKIATINVCTLAAMHKDSLFSLEILMPK